MRGLSPIETAALSLLDRRGGIDRDPKLMLEMELVLGVCDNRGVEFVKGGDEDPNPTTRVGVNWLGGGGVVVVVVVEAIFVRFKVEAELVEVELMLMLLFCSLWGGEETSTARLNRAVVATAGPLAVRIFEVVVVVDVLLVVRGKMEYVAVEEVVVMVILAALHCTSSPRLVILSTKMMNDGAAAAQRCIYPAMSSTLASHRHRDSFDRRICLE